MRELGLTDAPGISQNRSENLGELAGGAADDLEHLGHCRLLLQRLGQLARARLHLVEQTHVLDRDHRLVGEGGDKVNLLLGEWPHRLALQDNDPDWISFPQQWQPQHRASAADLRSFLQGVFRIGQNIGDLDDASFLQDTTEDRSAPGWDSMLFHERLVFGRITVKGNLPEGIDIRACDADHVRLTQARGGLDQRLEHNFEVEGRAADDLEYIAGSGLLLQAFAELVEQAGVLDGDDGLGREVLNQLDLLLGERAN